MKLPISQLVEGENILNYETPRDAWLREVAKEIGGKGYPIKGEMSLKLNLTKLEPDYYLRGELACEVKQVCARCAEPLVLDVRQPFQLAMAHVSTRKQEGQASEESEELDVHFFTGNDIDLSPIVEEQVLLGIPFQSLCSEGCLGICQQCGKNLNQGACACKKDVSFSPFAKLSGLKPKA